MRALLVAAALGLAAVVVVAWFAAVDPSVAARPAAVRGTAASAPRSAADASVSIPVEANGEPAGEREEAQFRPDELLRIRGTLVSGSDRLRYGFRAYARVTARPDELPLQATQLERDRDGAFDALFTRWRDGRPRWLVVGAYRQDTCTAWARVSIPALAEGEDVDLGVIRLEPPPLIAAGVVRDCAGEPIASATVAHLEEGVSADGWTWFGSAYEHTDDEGRFELRGWTAARVRLAAAKTRKMRELVTVARGASDVELVLDGAVVEGLVLRDEAAEGVHLLVSHEGDEHTPTWVRVGEDGRFRLEDRPSGTLSLRLAAPDFKAVLWTGEAHVGEDCVTTIPALDARGLFRSFEFRVVDEAGEPIEGARVRPEEGTGGNFRESTPTGRRGWTRVLAHGYHHPSLTVDVFSRSHRGRRITTSEDVTVVSLGSGVRVRLSLTDLPALPDRHRLGVIAHFVGDGPGGGELKVLGRFEGPRDVVLSVPCPGPWELRWSLHRTAEGSSRTVVVVSDDPPVQILDEADQVIEVSVPAGSILDTVRLFDDL